MQAQEAIPHHSSCCWICTAQSRTLREPAAALGRRAGRATLAAGAEAPGTTTIFRIVPFRVSATYRVPKASTATAEGWKKAAADPSEESGMDGPGLRDESSRFGKDQEGLELCLCIMH